MRVRVCVCVFIGMYIKVEILEKYVYTVDKIGKQNKRQIKIFL